MRLFGIVAGLWTVAAAAAPRAAVPRDPVWLGTFEPAQPTAQRPCDECRTAKVIPQAGLVQVLDPGDGSPPPTGDCVIASPLLGVIAHGHIDGGRVKIAWFNDDQRDGDRGVLILPADAAPRLVAPSAADLAMIKRALLRDQVLSGVPRALAGLEVGALDLDGDGRADLAVTYGCNAWGDGACQSRGQFFLARHGASWSEIE
ncbi:MAG TPA: hypothetical protein VLX92_33580 [Kofleriaceae bacterium]|nr:hypothetical protein [Kofleriaceae bacterium]